MAVSAHERIVLKLITFGEYGSPVDTLETPFLFERIQIVSNRTLGYIERFRQLRNA